MNRREATTLLGGAAFAWPLAARAQQPARMKRVGFLTGLDDSEARARFAAFSKALAALGWIADRNVEIVARFGTADPGRNRAHVTEIIACSDCNRLLATMTSGASGWGLFPEQPLAAPTPPDEN